MAFKIFTRKAFFGTFTFLVLSTMAYSETYSGTVKSLMVFGISDPTAGKRGHIQVQILNAPQLFILHKDDPYKSQMLAVLLSAQASGATVDIETTSPNSWATIYAVNVTSP
jgi:hypothetical protein